MDEVSTSRKKEPFLINQNKGAELDNDEREQYTDKTNKG